MDRNEQKNNFQNVQNRRKRESRKGGAGGILTVIVVVVLAVCIGGLGWQLKESNSRIRKQSADIKELRTKITNLEVALTPTPVPTATPEPTAAPETGTAEGAGAESVSTEGDGTGTTESTSDDSGTEDVANQSVFDEGDYGNVTDNGGEYNTDGYDDVNNGESYQQ